ncbi:MAG: MBL fold metallo-hydrolase [Clostridia bacterium]
MKIETFHVGIMQMNCYLAYDEIGGEAFIVDPGDNADMLLKIIAERKLALKYVILTHGHFDHVMAAHEILNKTNAKLVAGRAAKLDSAAACGFNMHPNLKFTPLLADITVADGDTLNVCGETLAFFETPGHTPGSICIYTGNELFSGDTLFAGSCGRCDFVGGDYNAMLASLRRIAGIAGDARVLPGHEGESTLSLERAMNPYIKEALSK